jgi:predicted dehydrogenase
MMTNRRLRMGLVGGGPGSFIGPVHRIAAELDREIELVAGAFSSNAERSRTAADSYHLDLARGYASLDAMIAAEAQRPDGIDFVAITTPNSMHAPQAIAALRAGLPVICDKPMTLNLAEARDVASAVKASGKPFALTYTYTGYPLARHARDLVRNGGLGKVRKVLVEYPQGWLAAPVDNKQAEWRGDPARNGPGGCLGDIGVHAFNLAEFITGLRVTEINVELTTFVPGRLLDDDVSALLRFNDGARGVLMASQVSVGELNGLRIRVYGETGGLDWRQEEPNSLTVHHIDGRTEIFRTGNGALSVNATAATRIPGGHPEGYLEAFANLYRDFAALVRGEPGNGLVQGIEEGVRGMAFIETAVAASGKGWTELNI